MIRLLAGILFAALLISGPSAASAGTVTRDEDAVRLSLARRFITAMQSDQMATMLGQMTTSLTPRTEGLTQEQQDIINRAVVRATGEMVPRLFDAMAPIYADIFTLEELDALVAFYESDIGRSMMTKSYAAAPRVTEVVLAMMPDLMRGMADTMCKEMGSTDEERARMDAEMARAGYGSTTTSAPPTRK